MCFQNAVKDSIKFSVKWLYTMDSDFCITYLKNTKFNPVTYLTATKTILVYTVNCCSNYTNIVSYTTKGCIHFIFWFIYKNFFT